MKLTLFIINICFFNVYLLSSGKDSTFSDKNQIENNLSFHINFLGSDSLEGRGTGTKGEYIASEYIKNNLLELKLKPAGNNGNWFQPIPLIGSFPLDNSELILYKNSEQIKFNLKDDYLLYNSGEETFIPLPVSLVFAGYGITAPEFDYNDYQSIDVEGKVVVLLSGEPISNDPNYFNGKSETIYSLPEAKQRIAISRGASGSIIIPVVEKEEDWDYYKNLFSFENISLPYSVATNLNLLFNPYSAEKLFTGSGYLYEEILLMHQKGNMKSFQLNYSLTFKGEFESREFISRNVWGMIEGTDPELKDSYLIISAHYDHLGIGPEVNNDSIYNGVFDNAIGVASAIEIARMLKQDEHKLKRSVIFLFLTGEEKGLIGSNFYTDHPVVPLYKTVANINVDGVAVFDEFNSIVGIGTEYSTLKRYFENTAEDLNLNVSAIPSQFEHSEAFYKSDQVAFALAGIPSLLTMDGIDYKNISQEEGLEKFYNYSGNIYHTPFDDLTQQINYSEVIQHINFLFHLSKKILTDEETPEWNENSPFLNSRLISRAEKK